jgi:hypothetical protein
VGNLLKIIFLFLIGSTIMAQDNSGYDFLLFKPSFGMANGTIILNANGDAGPFDIAIEPLIPPNQNVEDFTGHLAVTNLEEGIYTFTITDGLGCVKTEVVELNSLCIDVQISLVNIIHNTVELLNSPEYKHCISRQWNRSM